MCIRDRSLATVFLSCATLGNEFRSQSLHLVVTKPVSRVQILAGKWLGINALMGLLLVLCGLTVYAFAVFIKNRPVAFDRDRLSVRDVVWRARVAAKPVPLRDLEKEAREWVISQEKQGQVFARGPQDAMRQRMAELENDWRTIGPGEYEVYIFKNLIPPREADAAIQVRYRARGNPMPVDEMLSISFAFADPELLPEVVPMGAWHQTRERALDLHQFLAHGQGVIRNGQAVLIAYNPLPPGSSRIKVYFEQDDWMELLYTIGTFEENYLKTLVMIGARLALLSAVGLLFSVFVSFPVACFCVLTFYVICLGMPFWMESIGANLELRTDEIDPYGRFGPAVRAVLVPLLKFAFPNFAQYDGTDALIAGEYIRGTLLAKALVHTFVYGVVLLFLPGWWIFKTREVAEVVV